MMATATRSPSTTTCESSDFECAFLARVKDRQTIFNLDGDYYYRLSRKLSRDPDSKIYVALRAAVEKTDAAQLETQLKRAFDVIGELDTRGWPTLSALESDKLQVAQAIITGVDIYRKLQSDTSAAIQKLTQTNAELEQSMASKLAENKSLTEQAQAAQTQLSVVQALAKTKEDASRDALSHLGEELKTARAKQAELKRSARQPKERAERLEKELAAALAKQKAVSEQAAKEKEAAMRQVSDIKVQEAAADAENKRLSNQLTSKIAELENEKRECKDRVAAAGKASSDARVHALSAELEQLKKTSAEEATKFEAAIKAAKAEFEVATKRCNTANARIKELQQEKENLERQYTSELETSKRAQSESDAARQAMTAEIAALRVENAKRLDDVAKATAYISEKTKELAQKTKDCETLDAARSDLQAEAAQLRKANEALEDASEASKAQAANAIKEAESAKAEAATAKEGLAELQDANKVLQDTSVATTRELSLAREAAAKCEKEADALRSANADLLARNAAVETKSKEYAKLSEASVEEMANLRKALADEKARYELCQKQKTMGDLPSKECILAASALTESQQVQISKLTGELDSCKKSSVDAEKLRTKNAQLESSIDYMTKTMGECAKQMTILDRTNTTERTLRALLLSFYYVATGQHTKLAEEVIAASKGLINKLSLKVAASEDKPLLPNSTAIGILNDLIFKDADTKKFFMYVTKSGVVSSWTVFDMFENIFGMITNTRMESYANRYSTELLENSDQKTAFLVTMLQAVAKDWIPEPTAPSVTKPVEEPKPKVAEPEKKTMKYLIEDVPKSAKGMPPSKVGGETAFFRAQMIEDLINAKPFQSFSKLDRDTQDAIITAYRKNGAAATAKHYDCQWARYYFHRQIADKKATQTELIAILEERQEGKADIFVASPDARGDLSRRQNSHAEIVSPPVPKMIPIEELSSRRDESSSVASAPKPVSAEARSAVWGLFSIGE